MKRVHLLSVLLIALSAGACSIGQEAKRAERVFDFGLPAQVNPTSVRIPATVALQEISAPAWLATPALRYRLAYHDAAQLQSYANSRWAAAPNALLTLRLRQALNEVSSGQRHYQLRVDLEEFSQLFDTPSSSSGLLRARASLVREGQSQIIATRTFTVQRKAQSADAEGAMHALTEAGDALVENITAWLAETVAETNKK